VFACQHYISLNPDKEGIDCETFFKDYPKETPSTFLPQDIPEGYPSQKLLHYTIVFQVFVFMQLFNQLNARLIELGEFNIFKGIFRNWLFTFITILTFIIQIIMVEIGGTVTTCYPLGWKDNLVALAIGSGELIWGIIIKFFPLWLFQFYKLDEAPVEGSSLVGAFKKSSVHIRQK